MKLVLMLCLAISGPLLTALQAEGPPEDAQRREAISAFNRLITGLSCASSPKLAARWLDEVKGKTLILRGKVIETGKQYLIVEVPRPELSISMGCGIEPLKVRVLGKYSLPPSKSALAIVSGQVEQDASQQLICRATSIEFARTAL